MQLSTAQIHHFVNDGFIQIKQAFPPDLAKECLSILWKATGLNPDDRASWNLPVIRLGDMGHEPFRRAANTPVLHQAFDQLVGEHRWVRKETLGSFPIRFPGAGPSGDTGWHVDASFPGSFDNDFSQWRINYRSKGRALLMLFLFSDVTDQDAPTRIRTGSHLGVADLLYPKGEIGLSFMELAQRLEEIPFNSEVLATGNAGTVYLCHPFLVHAAQDHHGTIPKFMAQPPLIPKMDFNIFKDENDLCPVEKAIHLGIFSH